jgi:peptidoglycan/xylan/chitin deacetylase (PgdA/CDA1 family)
MQNNSRHPAVLILMYHRILDTEVDPWALAVTPHHFQEQLEVLRNIAKAVQLQELVQRLDSGSLADPLIVLTFDDGYADNLHNAKPLLERYEIPATVFVVTGSLGQPSEIWSDELEKILLHGGQLPDSLRLMIQEKEMRWSLVTSEYGENDFLNFRNWRAWQEPPTERHRLYYELWRELRPLTDVQREAALSDLRIWAGIKTNSVRNSHRTLSPEEVQKLENDFIEIGSHTITHPYLATVTPDEQWIEISESKSFLEKLLGHEIRSFAYPYGGVDDFNKDSVRLVREAGFSGACTTISAAVSVSADRFQLPRMQVQDWDGDQFAKQLREWQRGKTTGLWQS